MVLKIRRELNFVQEILPIKHLIKGWFSRAGIAYCKSHKMKDEEEELLEKFTDYCYEHLDELSPSKVIKQLKEEENNLDLAK